MSCSRIIARAASTLSPASIAYGNGVMAETTLGTRRFTASSSTKWARPASRGAPDPPGSAFRTILVLRDQRLLDVARHRSVLLELHRVLRLALRRRAQLVAVREHLGERHVGFELRGAGMRLRPDDDTAATDERGLHRALELLGRLDLDLH